MPNPEFTLVDPFFVGSLCVPVFLVLFITLAVWEALIACRRGDTGWKVRLPLYLCAFLLLYVPVAGFYTRSFLSMSRFTVCVQAVLTLAVLHLVTRLGGVSRRLRPAVAFGFILWVLPSVVFHAALAYRFTRGLLVA